MKLGKETGSMVNHLYSRMTKGQPNPEIGMGVTFLHWTDRSPGTIIDIFTIAGDVAIAVQADSYKRTDDNGAFTECQSYEFQPNPDGGITHYRLNSGKWRQVRRSPDSGRWVYADGHGLRIGERDAYYDPCF